MKRSLHVLPDNCENSDEALHNTTEEVMAWLVFVVCSEVIIYCIVAAESFVTSGLAEVSNIRLQYHI